MHAGPFLNKCPPFVEKSTKTPRVWTNLGPSLGSEEHVHPAVRALGLLKHPPFGRFRVRPRCGGLKGAEESARFQLEAVIKIKTKTHLKKHTQTVNQPICKYKNSYICVYDAVYVLLQP